MLLANKRLKTLNVMNDNKNRKKDENLNKNLDEFLGEEQELECDENGVCRIKTDKSLVERMNKKIITDDGRELLM